MNVIYDEDIYFVMNIIDLLGYLGDILIEGPDFKRKYFKLSKGENSTSTWMALQRPYILIISREKNFIREFWVREKITAGLQRMDALNVAE